MDVVIKASCILNGVSIVVAVTVITNGTMFSVEENSNDHKMCALEQSIEPVSAPSLISCVWGCSTRVGCQGATFDAESQECVACNGTGSSGTGGNNILTGAKLYEKSTAGLSAGVHTKPACLACWDSFENSSYLIVNRSVEFYPARDICIFGHGGHVVEVDTTREQAYLAQRLTWTNGSYWTHASAIMTTTESGWIFNKWIWADSWDSQVPDEVWAPGMLTNPTTGVHTKGCMLPQYDYKLSPCDRMGEFQVVCEKNI